MQWNLSNTATAGTKESGCIRKVAALSSTQQPLRPFDLFTEVAHVICLTGKSLVQP